MMIGIIRESKTSRDKRVPLTPQQCRKLMDTYKGTTVVVQPDVNRSYSDDEYREAGIRLSDDLSICDFLLGVKEVARESLIPGKTYFFFSHTAKMQVHNKELLKEILKKNVTLIDYEYLTDENNNRVVAFGRWAGIVGGYNALRLVGLHEKRFNLKPAWLCRNKEEVFSQLQNKDIPVLKILITGGGRVAGGAIEILEEAGILKVTPEEFLTREFTSPVFTQIDPGHYVKRKDGAIFKLEDFFNAPNEFISAFQPYTRATDLFIACHYWDPRSPVFFTREEMIDPGFRIRMIADVSCDVNGSVPSTIRTSTIEDPFYGYNPSTGEETPLFAPGSVSVMAVDNLPGELPRDASEDFGNGLLKEVFPALNGLADPALIQSATIADVGEITEKFAYLRAFIKE